MESKAVYYPPDPATQSVSAPLVASANFEYDATVYQHVIDGERRAVNIYSRCGNPTEYSLEEQVSLLENADETLATSSGMAAISTVLFSLLRNGDHVVADWTTYSSTHEMLDHRWTNFGISTSFVDTSDPEEVRNAIRPETKLLYVETIANPTMKISPIPELVRIAHDHDVLVLCDNTFASPYVARPLEWGVDIVVESASKFIGGHGDALGGTISLRYERLPSNTGYDMRWNTLTKLGGAISPFNSWLLLRGVQTLAVRMDRACENAVVLAKHLESKPGIRRVWYPGLPSHPNHATARNLFPRFGAMLTFEVQSEEAAVGVLDRLRLASFAGSLGSVRTTCQAPSTMAFLDVPMDQKARMNIRDGMIRVSAGIEGINDLIADFDHALGAGKDDAQ